MTLKSGLEITQRHENWYNLKAWVWFPIRFRSTMAVSLAILTQYANVTDRQTDRQTPRQTLHNVMKCSECTGNCCRILSLNSPGGGSSLQWGAGRDLLCRAPLV